MKILYLDCGMGAAGDMLTAALLELDPEPDVVLHTLNALGLPGVSVDAERSQKCGITGTHMRVRINGEEEQSVDVPDNVRHEEHRNDVREPLQERAEDVHNAEVLSKEDAGDMHDAEEHADGHRHVGHGHRHTSLRDVEQYIDQMPLPDKVKKDAQNVYRLLAKAESHAHGAPVENIHFHEVGTLDAIVDVTAVCLLMNRLQPDRIVATPVRTGFGQVRCAHGVMAVPAPATAYLLEGIPTYNGEIRGEMCTPTGAALLRYFTDTFSYQPLMRVEKIGYGMGTKDFQAANCVRAFLGETADEPEENDYILELRANVDDMTGEDLGFAMDQLFAAGARDVFTTPIGMKKNRPGILLTVLCTPADKEKMVQLIFHNTTTIGIRETLCRRDILKRREELRSTQYGEIHFKVAEGYGVVREKAEYEDLRRISEETGRSIEKIRREI